MAPARHIVSYFGNRYLDHLERDLEEVAEHGFDTVVHCVTEADVEFGRARVAEVLERTRAAGLGCWAGPWGVGGVFGGEAHSAYRHPGDRPRAGDPGLRSLVEGWTDAVAEAGAERVFWDEPEIGAPGSSEVVGFLDHATDRARSRGLASSVCLAAAGGRESLLEEVAGLSAVDDIGMTPYYLPPLSPDEVQPEEHVGRWADALRRTAEAHGTTAHLWVQGFSISAGRERLIADCAEVARRRGVSDLGFWGFRACEAVDIRPERPAEAWSLAREVFRS